MNKSLTIKKGNGYIFIGHMINRGPGQNPAFDESCAEWSFNIQPARD